MFKITRMRVAIAGALMALLFAFGVWVLLHPASIWVQPWRVERTEQADGKLIFGPYPTAEDFEVLKRQGVTRIVSLLNPMVPHEKVLLEQEHALARRHGMELLNFPMGSILGQKFGQDYHRNSRAAAEAALSSTGPAYIHCYLGMNRAKNVQGHLKALAPTSNYAGVGGSLADTEVHLRAEAAFRERRSQEVVELTGAMTDLPMQTLQMRAWSLYRLDRIDEARADFARILAEVPGDPGASTGLGYCALRSNDLDQAQVHFAHAVEQGYSDVSAVEGLGFVRFRQGRLDDAEALFQRALAVNPDNAEVQAALATVQRSRKASGAPGSPARG